MKLRIKIILVLISAIQLQVLRAATKSWSGMANDGQWSNAANWDHNSLPLAGDDVVLDNSAWPGNYTVTLPNAPVSIRTLSIKPQAGASIECILPATNTNTASGTDGSVAGLTLTGLGYGLWIDSGGIFLNASNASSGNNLIVEDSIRVNNGGRYIHHTRASHANNIVRLLSSAPGTESGIFEFDVPGTASYTVSMSNRIYGTLVFKSLAAGTSKTYACNGSNELKIKGKLEIDAGANFNVNLGGVNGNISIGGDLVQNGGVFNIASGAGNTTKVSVGGNFQLLQGSQITESNTGLPAVELNGSHLQHVSVAGDIVNSINFRINNASGIVLDAPLQLPFQLQLIKGSIKTSTDHLLILQAGCAIIADSTSRASFVDGPLRKQNINHANGFLFPVGKDGELRWMELKNVTGTYTVEFKREDPRILSNAYDAGIDHISSHEYWKIEAERSSSPGSNVELSFNTPSSGGVTDMSSLRVAALTGSNWMNAGQTGVSGSAGASGSVTSAPVFDFGPGSAYFTLASSLPADNPLPVQLESFSAVVEEKTAILNWSVGMPEEADHFTICWGTDGKNFDSIASINANAAQWNYEYHFAIAENPIQYFQIRIVEKSGRSLFSRIVPVSQVSGIGQSLHLYPNPVVSSATLNIIAAEAGVWDIRILSIRGDRVKKIEVRVKKGENNIPLDLPGLPAGMYQLLAWDDQKRSYTTRFMR